MGCIRLGQLCLPSENLLSWRLVCDKEFKYARRMGQLRHDNGPKIFQHRLQARGTMMSVP